VNTGANLKILVGRDHKHLIRTVEVGIFHRMEDAEFQQMRGALSWAELPDETWPLLKNVFRIRRLAAKETAWKPGERPERVYFVVSGLLRYFAGRRRSREYTKVFLWENQFSPLLNGCAFDSDLECGLQALEPTTVLEADAAAFKALYDKHPAFDRLGRLLGERWLAQKESRTLSFQRLSAKDRYQGFVRNHRDLVQRVSQIHIASYLGITEVSLSRIRRGLAQAAPAR
jgi:CRP-like cAMP-binding protein